MNFTHEANTLNYYIAEIDDYVNNKQPYIYNRITIHDSVAGSGKTYALSKIAVQLANKGQKVLFVQPTMELIARTLEQLDALHPSASAIRIDTDTTDDVVNSIMRHVENPGSEGQILFITHAAFERLPYVHRSDTWHLFIDEAPQAHRSALLRFKHTHDALTSLLKVTPVDGVWSELVIEDANGAMELRQKAEFDDALSLFREALNFLTSKHWSVYVTTESYAKLLNGDVTSKSEPMLFARLKPSICAGYKSVRIAGAHIRESIFAKLWKAQGAILKFEMLEDLRYTSHEKCKRVKIFYGIKRDWSKTLRDKFRSQIWDPLILKTVELSGNKKFLFLVNKDIKNPFYHYKKAIQLPQSPHGLNQYQDIDMVAFLSALNPHPQHYAFLKFLGLNSDEICRDVYYSKAYQAIMRGGIRNFEGDAVQTIVVPDQGLAEWLTSIFQGSSIEWLGIGLPEEVALRSGRPRIHQTNADKTKASRLRLERKDYELLYAELLELLPNDQNEDYSEINNSCYETSLIKRDKVTRFYATIWDNIESKLHSNYLLSDNIYSFIERLKLYHLNVFRYKEENSLFGIGLAAPNSYHMRGIDNVICANGIVLDNDGGQMTPDEFARMLPGVEIFIFNTFSSTPDRPRWRAYIPTATVMPSVCYTRIVARIFTLLEQAGFENHGFDKGKKSAADLMYLPCQAAHPEGTFFIEYRSPSRAPLDPMSWISFEDAPEILAGLVKGSAAERSRRNPRIEADFEDDILRWRTEGDISGNRNAGWTSLFFALLAKGMSIDRIQEVMTAEASLCHYYRDREARISQLARLIRGGKR